MIIAIIIIIVTIGLRTTAYYNEHDIGPLLEDYNELMRNISISRGFFLYDLDNIVWSVVDYNFSKHDALFVDPAHPHGPFVLNSANKLLGTMISMINDL